MTMQEMADFFALMSKKEEQIIELENLLEEEQERRASAREEIAELHRTIQELREVGVTMGRDVWANQIYRTEPVDEEEVNARETMGNSRAEHSRDDPFHLPGTGL